MEEEDIHKEYDSWLSTISKYIISRSSQLISSETQKDGRILLILSALSSLIYIGIITVEKYSLENIEFKIIGSKTFIPLIIEVVCLYFALSFAVNAYSELKIWQFKSLIKGSDDENPLSALKRENEAITKEGEAMLEKYKDLIEKAKIELELDTDIEPNPDFNDFDQLRKSSAKLEDRNKRLDKLQAISEIYYKAQNIELKDLDIKREILKHKIESLNMELPSIVRVYKLKHLINIVFPILSFVISLAAMIFYFIMHN